MYTGYMGPVNTSLGCLKHKSKGIRAEEADLFQTQLDSHFLSKVSLLTSSLRLEIQRGCTVVINVDTTFLYRYLLSQISYLHPKLPLCAHFNTRNRTKVIGRYNWTHLGSSYTGHSLQNKSQTKFKTNGNIMATISSFISYCDEISDELDLSF